MRGYVFGGLAFAAALAISLVSTLASPPMPQSSPQSTGPSVAVDPAPLVVPADKSVAPVRVEPLAKPLTPAPHRVKAIAPWVVDRYAWPNWLYFHPVSVVATVEKGSKEGDSLYAAIQELPGDYVGRVFFAVEFVDSSNPSIFDKPGEQPRKYGITAVEHDVKTHLTALATQMRDQQASWSDDTFRKKITGGDFQRTLNTDDLRASQQSNLSDASKTAWVKGRVDAESLRLWLDIVVGRLDTKQELKPGFARFRVLGEDNWVLLFGTRLKQPIVFVHGADKAKLAEDETLAPAARLFAGYAECHPWVVNADTKFGKDLHAMLSSPDGKSGTAPPADAASLICFQVTDPEGNPFAKDGKGKGHMGPFTLDPTKLTGDLERVLDKDVKLTRVATGMPLVTQTASNVEAVAPKK